MKKKSPRPGQVRIIAGKWRGQRIEFPDLPGLRPTPDRVRETLFNWLAPVIAHARCLDLFAGSGILSFEALSRGAKHVEMVDSSRRAVMTIQSNITKLATTHAHVHCDLLPQAIEQLSGTFDIVFLDPPYHQHMLPQCINRLAKSHLLARSALVYIECESSLKDLALPDNWQVIRNKVAGQVAYYLIHSETKK